MFDEKTAQQRWDTEIYAQSKEIDPHEDFSWDSMSFAWALALGATVEQAREFVRKN